MRVKWCLKNSWKIGNPLVMHTWKLHTSKSISGGNISMSETIASHAEEKSLMFYKLVFIAYIFHPEEWVSKLVTIEKALRLFIIYAWFQNAAPSTVLAHHELADDIFAFAAISRRVVARAFTLVEPTLTQVSYFLLSNVGSCTQRLGGLFSFFTTDKKI